MLKCTFTISDAVTINAFESRSKTNLGTTVNTTFCNSRPNESPLNKQILDVVAGREGGRVLVISNTF